MKKWLFSLLGLLPLALHAEPFADIPAERLTFRIGVPEFKQPADETPFVRSELPAGDEAAPPPQIFWLSKKSVFDHRDIAAVKLTFSESAPTVNIHLTDAGRQKLATFSRRNIGRQVVFLIQPDTLLSAPVIRDTISDGRLQIDASQILQPKNLLAQIRNDLAVYPVGQAWQRGFVPVKTQTPQAQSWPVWLKKSALVTPADMEKLTVERFRLRDRFGIMPDFDNLTAELGEYGYEATVLLNKQGLRKLVSATQPVHEFQLLTADNQLLTGKIAYFLPSAKQIKLHIDTNQAAFEQLLQRLQTR